MYGTRASTAAEPLRTVAVLLPVIAGLKREVQVWMLGEDEPRKLRFLFELDRLSRAIKSGGDNVGWGVFGSS